MKKLKQIVLGLALLIGYTANAQQGINYKALIKDDLGNVVVNQNVRLQFTILAIFSNGSPVFQETHDPIMSDANGIIITNIGDGAQSLSYGAFDDIDWGSHKHYLRVGIDITGGTNFVNMTTTEFNAVPYAKHAEIATNVSGLEKISEVNPETGFSQTGWRLIGMSPANYGTIGQNAIDLSYSSNNEELRGATGREAIAMGYNVGAYGYRSTAIGNSSKARGDYSLAAGSRAQANGTSSTAMGSDTFATGTSSMAMGDNTFASGRISTAMGIKTTAQSYAEIAIGSYNTSYVPSNTTDWDVNDRLFVIGNGQSTATANNAVTVLKNGNFGVNTSNPESLFEIAHQNGRPTPTNSNSNGLSIRNLSNNESWQFYSHQDGYLELLRNKSHKGSFNPNTGVYATVSDRRTKKDITPLENGTLNKVMQLNPVSYIMKDQTDSKRNLGLISQEAQELFPSITHYIEESDLLTLSYTELIPVLIKAIQEQQTIIDSQKTKTESLENQLAKVFMRLETFEATNN
ncbi:tail fiber domain-containing protein [Bizionia arctica]|uniref:Peptidase S74 domain-containing protein n=1 Tax=Bizionia arctica TaxID=1495645 RepID=A0A917GGH6_9FLAO|nr:tail fiber domain-containing protein [Bizionia arctica]GGG44453.1 hypothetical protein GCM10010976_15050 [Bizionia arctica]